MLPGTVKTVQLKYRQQKRGQLPPKNMERDDSLADSRYRILFDHSPISIWEEDFSEVRAYLAGFKFKSSKDLINYFRANPEKINEALSLIRVIDVNQTSLKAWNHSSKDPLLGSLQVTYDADNTQSFINELNAIFEDIHFYQIDDQKVTTENGENRHLSLYWSVIPGHEKTWDQVLVSAIDITKQKNTEKELANTQIILSNRVQELEKRNQEMRVLSDMLTMLQFVADMDEAYSVIGQHLNQLFDLYHGELLTLDEIKQELLVRYSWGDTFRLRDAFQLNDCWALRTGKPFFSEENNTPLHCHHIQPGISSSLFCVPVMIDASTMGCISIASLANHARITEDNRRLILAVADQIGLALTNIKLKQHLREQAIHDGLTGLYNRLYLEETFERELYRLERNNQPLSVLMIDLDHLKGINDIYGHAAGDAALRELGKLIKKNIRASDMPCRYGGDEFILVMPETKLDTAVRRAERIADAFRHLSIPFGTQTLGDFSLSIGVASAPVHGHTRQDLLDAADKALYDAKNSGRDRVVSAPIVIVDNQFDIDALK